MPVHDRSRAKLERLAARGLVEGLAHDRHVREALEQRSRVSESEERGCRASPRI
jgi:hypothetical protein